MAWKVTTAPATEILTTSDVKNYLKIDSDVTTDDTLIGALITAARQTAEQYINQGLITQTVTEKFDCFDPGGFLLSVSPVLSVTSVKYQDQDDAEQTLSTSVYRLDLYSKPARVRLAYGQTWPETIDNPNAVSVIYQVGYGPLVTDVPESIKQAIRLIIADMYENRTDSISRLPKASEYLLNPYRIKWF